MTNKVMKETCPKYRRRNNHVYLKAAWRTVKNGFVEFAGYQHLANGNTQLLEGKRLWVEYESGNLVAWCGHRWVTFLRLRATFKTSNVPIWDYNTWVPTLKPKRK